ncbi:TIGR03982 family His-Xaa-Ser system protein [Spongiibacter tropicus]|uniref:TIGR03982 family His-Xaa-Ser system protein n=1 Tax=Spongiibacter tropicus TaxID=454602 RepID=UPI0035BE4269
MRKLFQISVTLFCLSWLLKNIALPLGGYFYLKSDYLTQTSQCANAMDETWFVEQEQSESLNKTAQVHLLACHEYDKTRKMMIALGVTENILSYIELNALEINQHSIEQFVEHHRFPNR